MKQFMFIVAGMLLFVSAQAKLVAGPGGGKIVGEAPDRAEVLISDDGVVTVSFLDDQGQAAAIGSRSVSLFALLESGRQEVTLNTDGDKLVSAAPLPQPEGYTLVVQIRATADAKPVNARLQFITHVCGGCSLKEYACTCDE